jgi:LCP family protein required for cell wall assembly
MSGWPDEWARDRRRQPVAPGARTRTEPLGPRVGGPPPMAVRPRRRRRGGRVFLAVLALLLVALLAVLVVVDSRLNRVDALGDWAGRPAATPGADWLIVGSDSRQGLSAADRQRLATGQAAGRRTDTMMLLHIPRSGAPTLVSLPRDSYVPIPGHGRNKLNAAYAFGGPKLLAQTVEGVTGIRVDHYMEIGFDGFASLVDAAGGVSMCIPRAMNDPKAGLRLNAGCQVLDSRQALGYVRTRAGGRGDLDRVVRQQQFLSALIGRLTSPGVLLNPLRSVPLAFDGADAVTVDRGDHAYHLVRLPFAMRAVSSGKGVATTVPVASTPIMAVGSVVIWDRPKALALFEALRQDRPVGNLVQQG